MLMPQKKFKSTGLITLLLSVIMIITCFTTACQPTPDDLIVQQKKEEEFNEAIQRSADPGFIANDSSSSDNILEHWKESFQRDNGKVNLNIDSDVSLPVGNISVVTLRPRSFTDAEVNRITKLFTGDNLLYGDINFVSAESLQEQILMTMAQMKDLDSDLAQSSGAKTLEELEQIGLDEIERLTEEANKIAESNVEPKILDIDMIASESSQNIQSGVVVNANIGTDSENKGTIYISNNSEIGSQIIYKSKGVAPEALPYFTSDNDISLNITSDDALANANDTLTLIGLSDMTPINIEKGYFAGNSFSQANEKCYKIVMLRDVNNLCVEYIQSRTSSKPDEQKAPPLGDEYIECFIGDNGVIGFVANSPLLCENTVNENVAIKDFNEIKEIFVQQFFNENSYKSDNIEYVNFNIINVRLSLARLKSPDKTSEYVTVPVWDFYGETATKYTGDAIDEELSLAQSLIAEGKMTPDKIISINENNEIVEINTGVSFSTINATTGTVINRYLGY